jgi:2-keto-4-pentenoate hydratase
MTVVDEAAGFLAGLWRSGRQEADFPPGLKPSTLDAGYDIQDRFIAGLGERVMGWKLGVGSQRQRVDTGIGRSVAGRVLGSRTFAPGDTVPLPGRAPVTVEFEIGFVLGQEIRPDATPADPMTAVSEARVTFELVRSRFVDRRVVGWPSFAADNGGFEALIVGAAVPMDRLAAVAESVVVLADGTERARCVTGADVTDPVTAFTGFVALARERGMVLPEGAIVSTGTVTTPFNIEGEATILARYLGLECGFRTSVASPREG